MRTRRGVPSRLVRKALKTERVMLRHFTGADVEDLVALHGDPAVMRRIDDGRPVPRDVVESHTLPRILRGSRRQIPRPLCR